MTEHTTGPWEWTGTEDSDYGADKLVAADGSVVLYPRGDMSNYRGHLEEFIEWDHKADARLIAAAPGLLAALEGLVEHAEEGMDDYYRECTEGVDDSILTAREAIRKARGSSDG